MPEELTPQQLLELVVLIRNVQWRYQLDQYEAAALRLILATVQRAERTILTQIQERGAGLTEWQEARSLALLDELSDLTLGLRAALVRDIADVASHAGAASYLTHNAIVSFDGLVVPFVTTVLTANQLRSLITDTPFSGRLLRDWVDRSFDQAMISGIKEEILAGRLAGEAYPELVDRIAGGFGMVRRDAISLVRTYVQSANVSAMEAVYEANRDVVQGVQWVATMEVGTGRRRSGTCIRCAVLDGQKWKWDEPRPSCPLHIRCRCVLVPMLISWRELGIDIEEFAAPYRPWTRRGPGRIDTGGRRTILEHGFHQGDFSTWFVTLSEEDQRNIVGPGRLSLLRSNQISFRDLVDRDTGRLRLLARDTSGHIAGLR